jgi:hypothetical protein
MHTHSWVATYGIKQMRGGWLVTEQHIISAIDYPTAWKIGRKDCPRGETLMSIDLIKQDLDPLDYDSIDVI